MNEYTKNKTIMIIKTRDPNYARRLLTKYISKSMINIGDNQIHTM